MGRVGLGDVKKVIRKIHISLMKKIEQRVEIGAGKGVGCSCKTSGKEVITEKVMLEERWGGGDRESDVTSKGRVVQEKGNRKAKALL